MKLPLRKVWRLAVILLVLAAAWQFIDFGELVETFRGIALPWLLLLLALAALDRYAMAAKWQHLLSAAGAGTALATIISVYFQAAFVQRLLPSSLGGDAYRGMMVIRRHGNSHTVLASMVVEKLVAMAASILLAAAAAIFVLDRAGDERHGLLLLAIPVLTAAFLVGLRVSLQENAIRWMLERIPWTRGRNALAKIYDAYLLYRRRPGVPLANLFYALAEQSLQVLILVIAAVSLSVEATLPILVAAVAISQCLRKFAIVLEGWALGEFTNVVVCTMLGIPAAQALAFSLLGHAVSIAVSLPGAALMMKSPGGLRKVRDTSIADVSAASPQPGAEGGRPPP